MNRGIAGALTMAAVIATVSFRLGAASWTGKRRIFTPGGASPDPRERTERVQRVRAMDLDEAKLRKFISRFGRCTREQLIEQEYLAASGLPRKGGALIGPAQRTELGNRLLREAKDTLFALLFGDASMAASFDRVERELLTLTVPRSKVREMEFMKASTELSGSGTWQDPEDVASDERADNVIIEVEYGEVRSEAIGDGIVATLRLINLLELNEQVIYARMTNIEQSTLAE